MYLHEASKRQIYFGRAIYLFVIIVCIIESLRPWHPSVQILARMAVYLSIFLAADPVAAMRASSL